MDWFVSESTKGFYLADLREVYENAGSWPSDALPITETQYLSLRAGLDNGKVLHFDGDTVTLADPPPLTEDQIVAAKVAIVQAFMDAKARALNYDDMASAVSYAEEPAVPKFQAEGQALRAWRSLVWQTCYSIFDEVKAGARSVPSDEELLAALPALSLPT
jgi:muconolactone delta-isomerase